MVITDTSPLGAKGGNRSSILEAVQRLLDREPEILANYEARKSLKKSVNRKNDAGSSHQ